MKNKASLTLLPAFTRIMAAVAALSCTNVLAHHSSTATFKADEDTSAQGVITDYRFRNPHVLVYLDVTNDDGTVTNWMSEGSSATTWRRSGWDADSLKPGDFIRVTGNATIDGSPMVWIDQIEMLDSGTNEVVAVLSPNENPEVSLGLVAAAQSHVISLAGVF